MFVASMLGVSLMSNLSYEGADYVVTTISSLLLTLYTLTLVQKIPFKVHVYLNISIPLRLLCNLCGMKVFKNSNFQCATLCCVAVNK